MKQIIWFLKFVFRLQYYRGVDFLTISDFLYKRRITPSHAWEIAKILTDKKLFMKNIANNISSLPREGKQVKFKAILSFDYETLDSVSDEILDKKAEILKKIDGISDLEVV